MDSDHIQGTVEHITYHDSESGFVVLRLRTDSPGDLTNVVGNITAITEGEEVEARGKWVTDPNHGLQFRAESLRTQIPTTAEGAERYLASGAVRGIGPKLAERIVALFGDQTFQLLDRYPQMLTNVEGIGKAKLAVIKESWKEQQSVREIMMFLHDHGIGSARAVRIHRLYGEDAVTMIEADPYRLARDVRGIGFQTADQLARRLGLDEESPQRLQAGVQFALRQLSGEGHTGVPFDDAVHHASRLLGVAIGPVEQAVRELIAEESVVQDDINGESWVFALDLHEAEVGIARSVGRLMGWGLAKAIQESSGSLFHPLRGVDPERQLPEIEQRLGVELAEEQREAILSATRERFVVITGGPGVGKTTLVRTLLELFEAADCECVLAAPTGRAARRLAETTDRTAKTIHRLLEFDPMIGGFRRGEREPLDGDLFVLDEVSMVDVLLANAFLDAVPTGAVVVMVGDVDQLPSVGPGSVLKDLIDSGQVPVTRLMHIFRQARDSQIVAAAHAINHGQFPTPDTDADALSDFYFTEVQRPEAVREMIVKLVSERIPDRFGFDPLRDIQVLTPMNKGPLGRHALNETLQQTLNPGPKTEVTKFGVTLRLGDRVMQTVNNYDRRVFNGDLGSVTALDTEQQELTVSFEQGPITYDFGSLDELSLAYVLSIHKSQGSEYPAVVIPVHQQHYVMLRRNLFYTGITRGKQLVVLVGTRSALQTAISRTETSARKTTLKWRLSE